MTKNLVDVKDLIDAGITKSRPLKEGILKSEWDKIVGDLSKKSFVLFLKDKKVFVGVENSIWIQQLNFQKKEIIKKINELFGEEYVKDLIFKIGRKNTEDYFLEDNEEIHEEEIDLDTVKLTEEEYIKIEKELEEIEDKEIKKRTKDILEKSYKRKKYLKLHGYRKCQCGIYYSSEEPKCAICINKEVLKLEETLMKAFKNKKLLNYLQAKEKFKNLTEKEYERIKIKKLSKIKKNIDIYIKSKNLDKALELSKLYLTIDLGNTDKDYIDKRAKEFLEIMCTSKKN
ncbi:MAG: hypothetical protein DSY38_03070 [Fusobacteria bacterium]|nr:MAG: hypothetical protein DSY38_03070 [Fusobacteriota bacterium]